MSLKDLTWDKHQAAEATDFMKSVFKKKMPTSVWADYTYNKMLWYGAIETKASAEGYLDDLPGIQRAYFLYPSAEIAAHLGEVLWVRGERDKARDIWRAGRDKDPNDTVLVDTLKRFAQTF